MEQISKVEDIPSNELVVMTKQFHNAFKTYDCDPACHCCWKKIKPSMLFKLATIQEVLCHNPAQSIEEYIENYEEYKKSKEVMLCEKCTPELFDKKQKRELRKTKVRMDNNPSRSTLGCFRINGKIIH